MNILIIGATSGIGRELCLQYANGQNTIYATGRREALLDTLTKEHKSIITRRLDIVNQADTLKTLQQIWNEAKRIDLAIVCAGIGDLNPNLDHQINDTTIQTNVVGWTNVVDFIYHQFEQQHSGHLVTISSLSALRGEPIAPAYSATKAFQSNYTEALCKKAYKSGNQIFVTEIRPGLVDTAMAKGEGLFWVQPTDKVAHQIISAIEHKKHLRIVTHRWRILAFIMQHLP